MPSAGVAPPSGVRPGCAKLDPWRGERGCARKTALTRSGAGRHPPTRRRPPQGWAQGSRAITFFSHRENMGVLGHLLDVFMLHKIPCRHHTLTGLPALWTSQTSPLPGLPSRLEGSSNRIGDARTSKCPIDCCPPGRADKCGLCCSPLAKGALGHCDDGNYFCPRSYSEESSGA